MTFANAVKNTPTYTFTENGAKTLDTSKSAIVDLFFYIGSARNIAKESPELLTSQFERAYGEDPVTATKILLWARDIRGGAGERLVFRKILQHLENAHPDTLEAIMWKIPELGRWDDMLVFQTTKFKERAYEIIFAGLQDEGVGGLVAKWLPRKGPIANELRKNFGAQMNREALSPKEYRKMVVGRTNVVEQKMCAKQWNAINFEGVPSVAMARYTKAFTKNASAAFQKYKDALVKGEAKVNAGAVYPYDVVKTIACGDKTVAKAQWDSLRNFLGDNCILPMVDVSGSMSSPVAGGKSSVTCLDVAVSIGLYVADKQQGPFNGMFMTFSNKPKIEILQGDIVSKYHQLNRAQWDMNTNLEAAFREILVVATQQNVAPEDMPKMLLILSDMEFDSCVGSSNVTNFERAKEFYEQAGYTLPKVVFWNIQSRSMNNVPIRANETGTALVSGFSPAIFESLLAGEIINPLDIVLKTVNKERYEY